MTAHDAPSLASLLNTTAAFRGEQSTLIAVRCSGRLSEGVNAFSLGLEAVGFDPLLRRNSWTEGLGEKGQTSNEYEAAPGASRKLTTGA